MKGQLVRLYGDAKSRDKTVEFDDENGLDSSASLSNYVQIDTKSSTVAVFQLSPGEMKN